MRVVLALLIVIIFTAILFSYHTVRQLSRFLAKRCDADIDFATLQIPEDFIFGASTSAYQIEGAWNESGKGMSIWDAALHNHPEVIKDRTNADVTTDSYHRYKDDVAALKRIGVRLMRILIKKEDKI